MFGKTKERLLSPNTKTEGGYLITPYDPGFEQKMEKAEEIMGRYRNTLRALAK